ncbi:tyrosine-type recombinase/integrase [Streptomyces sp. AV19]|uniref:tyrosine-type recombinase/integrase n=1 Tax=Streptomyces sp. AV19 TaxID=2793068 RepID=UPI0018FE70A1|nr:tyrosine-type recombinase/integrase [Streptomyces sp. AV19]MBH1938639.1 tyrosine-type recombinase/integrase [Streptomyces sp. AV19]MDG4535351.1 tyrosine-type recombinase/integrase [Streptomyces sp. AV19]
MDTDSMLALLDSWILHLAAERKSSQTIKTYGDGVRRFAVWCDGNGVPPQLDKKTVNAFVAALLEAGSEPATARSRQLALRRFSVWLVEEGEIDTDQLAGLKAPKLDSKVVPELSEDQLKALIKACQGKEFWHRRDEAIVRLMIETGARAGEVVAMETEDVDLKAGSATIRRGKGGKGRVVPLSPQTCRSIDRYLRVRRSHRLADTPALWLGDRGKNLGYHGLYCTLTYRAEAASIPDFHPHVLRHTAAGRWLEKGGSEGGLMAVAGWSRRDMIDRYTKASSQKRAADEARRLNLGDL